jgi:hypothetical protein
MHLLNCDTCQTICFDERGMREREREKDVSHLVDTRQTLLCVEIQQKSGGGGDLATLLP